MSVSIIDYEQYKRDDFYYLGNHRAIVEENFDPSYAGRVRVRVYGLHSPLSSETPVSHLPWAQPCLKIAWSGGHNMSNKEGSDTHTRYNPGNATEETIPQKNVRELTPNISANVSSFIDQVEDDCGTGGHFEVPRKGTIVWVFFENGDHNTPHYWAASPKQLDWVEQQDKITSDVNGIISDISDLRDNFDPDKEIHGGSEPADNAAVQTFCSKPRMSVYPIDGIPQQNISSWTSAEGTTFIVVNETGKERIYIINKGTLTHINEYGHKKELVGVINDDNQNIKSNDEKLVAGHSELHIMGDYNVFTDGNCFFQVQGNAQINVTKNVGIVTKEGDVDVVVEKGNCNLEITEGNMNSHVGGDLQVKVAGDTSIKAQGDLDAEIGGSTNVNSTGSITIKSGQDLTLDASSGSLNILCDGMSLNSNSDISIICPDGLNVDAGSSFKVDATGFGGDVAMNAPISNAFHSGCYAGPGAGAPMVMIAETIPAIPAIILPIEFISSPKASQVSDGVKPEEKTDDVDAPDNPDITQTPE